METFLQTPKSSETRRLEFQSLLEQLLGTGYVYFQPPPDVSMVYPCIVYERDSTSVKRADNKLFNFRQRYQVTYIDKLPDSDVFDKLVEFPLSAWNRHFATSGLNHDVFVIYH